MFIKLWMIAVFIFCFAIDGFSAEVQEKDKKPAAVETEINLDQLAWDDRAARSNPQKPDAAMGEGELIQLGRSLKNAIDENKELKKDRERVLEEIKQLRGEREVGAALSNALTRERDELKRLSDAARENALKSGREQDQKIQELQTASGQKIQELQTALDQEKLELQTAADKKTRDLEAKLKEVEERLAKEKKWNEELESLKPPENETAPGGAAGGKKQSLSKMLSRVRQLTEENDKLKNESAKIHYNLGNIFFKQGDYQRSVDEYAQALKWMPYDAANHYNLALVSGEFLNDQKTALKHYQQYLFLNPNAKDAAFVKEKILKARMEIKSLINSPIEKKSNINDDF